MNLRTKIIQKLIHINESVFFYPALKRFYRKELAGSKLNIIDVGANKGQSIDFFLKINYLNNLKVLHALVSHTSSMSPCFDAITRYPFFMALLISFSRLSSPEGLCKSFIFFEVGK